MTRWIMIAMALIGLIMAIFTSSPGVLGLALLMCFVGAIGTVFSIAADRVSANSRPDVTMLPAEALAAIRDKARANAIANAQAASGGQQGPAAAVAGTRQQ